MAQTLKKLSEWVVKNALRADYYADGGGLYLQVSNVGTKSWVYRFLICPL
jgi:hypothetical protein